MVKIPEEIKNHGVDNSAQPMSVVKNKKKSTIIKEGQKQRSNKKHHYVDNAALFIAICKYQDDLAETIEKGLPPPKISDFIGESIMKICMHTARHPSFARYTYIDIMIDDAVESCIKAVPKFDRTKSENPFSYLTQTCSYSFLNTMWIEDSEIYVKYKSLLESITRGDGVQHDTDEDASTMLLTSTHIDITHVQEFVERFENKLRRKREKSRRSSEENNDNELDRLFE